MPRKPKAIVLDSWAIMAYWEDEPAAEQVADIITNAHEEDVPLFMSVVNVARFGTYSHRSLRGRGEQEHL